MNSQNKGELITGRCTILRGKNFFETTINEIIYFNFQTREVTMHLLKYLLNPKIDLEI